MIEGVNAAEECYNMIRGNKKCMTTVRKLGVMMRPLFQPLGAISVTSSLTTYAAVPYQVAYEAHAC